MVMPHPTRFPSSTMRLAQAPLVKYSGPSSASLLRVLARLGTLQRCPTGVRKPFGVKKSLPDGK